MVLTFNKYQIVSITTNFKMFINCIPDITSNIYSKRVRVLSIEIIRAELYTKRVDFKICSNFTAMDVSA